MESPNRAAKAAIKRSEEELREGFNGIITSIFISLAIKLAAKYIMKWLEDELFSTSVPQEFSENK